MLEAFHSEFPDANISRRPDRSSRFPYRVWHAPMRGHVVQLPERDVQFRHVQRNHERLQVQLRRGGNVHRHLRPWLQRDVQRHIVHAHRRCGFLDRVLRRNVQHHLHRNLRGHRQRSPHMPGWHDDVGRGLQLALRRPLPGETGLCGRSSTESRAGSSAVQPASIVRTARTRTACATPRARVHRKIG